MKKIVVFLLLGFASFVLLAGGSAQAADDLVDLYPYDQIACLEASTECSYTKVGSAHWTMEYAGHRYHFVKGTARYVTEFTDDDSNGFYSDAEIPGLSWNAFAVVTINDTDEKAMITTTNARTDITDVVHRKYSYFDETGQLTMFEDHVSVYYIHNDGDAVTPDWRLATQAEIDAFDAAADPVTETPNTRNTYIRMALDDTDTDGYVIEPISYLKWTNADVDTATAPVEDWSTIINGDGVLFDGDPNTVIVPAGWTVVSWGTNDRGTLNPLTTQYILDMPGFMLDDTLDPMVTVYDPQPAVFAGITDLDDDLVTAGTNIVVDYNGTFDLDATISTSWVNMFDTAGKIINSTEKLDYAVTISRDGTDLETIDFTYDSVADAYTASAAVSVIDSSEFGAGYTATWSATTPEGDVTEVEADIVIGVMPPKFAGVEDQFIDQGTPIDLLEGITADDGYGNDKTSSISVTYPDGFNTYNPFPGEYVIDLEFVHHVHFDGETPTLSFTENLSVQSGGVDMDHSYVWDPSVNLNADKDISGCALCVWTDPTHFRDAATGWSSVIVIVGADGLVDAVYERYGWNLYDENGTFNDGGATFLDWQANVVVEDGGYVLGSHGTASAGYYLRYLRYDDPISLSFDLIPDFDYDIVTQSQYTLTVDDTTAPILMVVDGNYSIYAGEYDSVNDAILANVVAYDFTDAQDDLVKYVSNNGGLDVNVAGTYTVEVTVEDAAGHTDVQSFDVEVVAALQTEQDILDQIQDAIDNDIISEADVQALLDAQTLTDAEIQALIDAAINELPEDEVGTSLVVTIVVSIVAAGLAFGGAYLLFGKK